MGVKVHEGCDRHTTHAKHLSMRPLLSFIMNFSVKGSRHGNKVPDVKYRNGWKMGGLSKF